MPEEHPLDEHRHELPPDLDGLVKPPAPVRMDGDDRLPLLHLRPLLGMDDEAGTPVMGCPRRPCHGDEGTVVQLHDVPVEGGIDDEAMLPGDEVARLHLRVPTLDL